MLDFLRKRAKKVDNKAIVVQRLKRSRSIYQKMVREKGMALSRIEDIAGCRAVVKSIKDVKKLQALIVTSKTKNKLHRERDYLIEPKGSGYRGLHFVFKYNGGKDAFKGLCVELQIRSKIQHSWATAVEVVGAYTDQALKASSGEKKWLNFFLFASLEFSKLEGEPVGPKYMYINTFKRLHKLVNELRVLPKLSAFTVMTEKLSGKDSKKGGYYILKLDTTTRKVEHWSFKNNHLEPATHLYNQLEDAHSLDHDIDVVMVSADSVFALKRAYPNYFADTREFQNNLAKVFARNKVALPQ